MEDNNAEPIINIKEGRYFAAIWYIEGGNKNWMAALWRDGSDGAMTLSGRFRYYVDDKRHDSDDVKRIFEAETKPHLTEAQAVSDVDQIADKLIKAGFGRTVEKLILRTDDPDKVLKALSREKWAGVKRVPA